MLEKWKKKKVKIIWYSSLLLPIFKYKHNFKLNSYFATFVLSNIDYSYYSNMGIYLFIYFGYLNQFQLKIQLLSWIGHLSSNQKLHMASGYCIQ